MKTVETTLEFQVPDETTDEQMGVIVGRLQELFNQKIATEKITTEAA